MIVPHNESVRFAERKYPFDRTKRSPQRGAKVRVAERETKTREGEDKQTDRQRAEEDRAEMGSSIKLAEKAWMFGRMFHGPPPGGPGR